MVSQKSEVPDASNTWEIQLKELGLFASIANSGLGWGESALAYEDVIKAMSDVKHRGKARTAEDLANRRAHAERVQAFAADQKAKGFPYLYNLLGIRVWTILENLVDNLTLAQVKDPDKLVQLKNLDTISVPLLQFLSADDNDRGQYIVDSIKQACKARLKVGVGRFESILEAVGLGGSVPSPIARLFLELSELRNVLVHKDGLCDKRISERCPWLGYSAGEKAEISRARYDYYRLLPVWYGFELHRRTGNVAPNAVDVLDITMADLESKLSEAFPLVCGHQKG